jgi:glucokinase
MSATETAIGLDVGGTKILAGLVDRAGRVLHSDERPMRRDHYLADLRGAAGTMAATARERGLEVIGVGAGITGFVDHAAGRLIRSMNLDLEDVPVAEALQNVCGAPGWIDNDLHAAALGELYFGAGQRHADFVLFNAGTGIAAGLVFGGRLHRGASNVSGEICHTSVEQHGPACICGLPGCLEDSVLRLRRGEDVAPVRLARMAPPPAPAYGYVALGIIHLVNLLNPAAVVLAGGMFTRQPAATQWVAEAVRMTALPLAVAALKEIGVSAAGAAAGLVGAAALVWEGVSA